MFSCGNRKGWKTYVCYRLLLRRRTREAKRQEALWPSSRLQDKLLPGLLAAAWKTWEMGPAGVESAPYKVALCDSHSLLLGLSGFSTLLPYAMWFIYMFWLVKFWGLAVRSLGWIHLGYRLCWHGSLKGHLVVLLRGRGSGCVKLLSQLACTPGWQGDSLEAGAYLIPKRLVTPSEYSQQAGWGSVNQVACVDLIHSCAIAPICLHALYNVLIN